jgi:8-oxo-dGTP pyrophosphatase MutT (NUDIX family)
VIAAHDTPDPIPAATVVLVRDAPAGLETLLLRRSSQGAFAGAWVFPGGRIEAGDWAPDPSDVTAAACHAAAREAREETALVVDPASMVWFAHWVPDILGARRRYATWFFVAPAPPGAVQVDGTEIHEARWITPGAAQAGRDAGEIELVPPTWMTLHYLAGFATTAALLQAVRARSPEFYVTRRIVGAPEPVACWDGDAAIESGDLSSPGPRHRLWMAPGGWRLERDPGLGLGG